MKRILYAVTIIIMSVFLTVPVHANSGLRFWEGSESSDVSSREENCPLTVEHETLTFDIRSLPDISSLFDGEKQEASVTAEYTFHNPGQEDIRADLVFPFGAVPFPVNTGSLDSDPEGYSVLINGEKADYSVRITLDTGDFNIRDSLAALKDEYTEDEFFRPDLTVTEYVIEAENIDDSYTSVWAAVFIPDGRRICFLQNGNGGGTGDEEYLIQHLVDEGNIDLYVIGEPYDELPEIRFYEDGSMEKQINGDAVLKQTGSMTLEELLFEGYDSASGISRTDWYNTSVAYLNRNKTGRIIMEYYAGREFHYSELMRWFEYVMEVRAGQTVINTVTAPLYPSIDENYEPPICTFTYLLSPAGTWASFRDLEVKICTDLYLSGNDLFEKTDYGYAYSSEVLPDGELSFSLCSDSSPDHKNNAVIWIILGTVLVCVILFALAVILLVKLVLALFRRRS